MPDTTKCFETMTGKIDRTNGIISGVSVITVGDAKGHGLKIDHRTLETVLEVAQEFKGGVKVKERHKSTGQHQSVLGEVIGTLKNFSLSGKKCLADFHLFKSLSAETKEKIFEMAEVMPDQFGFSIDFSGVSEEKDGVKFARCEELNSVDLSDKPAANPDGLFSMKSIKYESGDKGKHAKDCDCAECEKSKSKSMSNDELQGSLLALTQLVKQLSEKFDAIPATSATTTLSFKNEKGETVQLSAQDISNKLNEVTQLAATTKATTETALKKSIIDKMNSEGRVPMKSGKAYTRAELEAFTIENLQFVAENSPRIPLSEIHKIRGGDSKKSNIPAEVKGGERVQAALSERGMDDIDALMSAPIGTSI